MPIFRLNADPRAFPDPAWAGPEGLLAVGGDLAPERLLHAYRRGIFPWYSAGEPILWWSPDPRCVLIPGEQHVSRRLRRTLRQQRFRVTCNRTFDRVVSQCAEVRREKGEGTWLVPDMQAAYQRLHRLGYAHSIEAWQGDLLAGGLYGVAMGPFFFGESMFHQITDASKVVLVTLTDYLQQQGFILFDCQVPNPHLLSMGARNLPRPEFLAQLAAHAAQSDRPFERFRLPAELPPWNGCRARSAQKCRPGRSTGPAL